MNHTNTSLSSPSPADGEAEFSTDSKTYVLVHGAWQAPYVWDAVSSGLLREGHRVIVVGLPGHGTDTTPPQNLTLDIYRDKVIEAISEVAGEVILVGHSLAGMIITHVAGKVPSRISRLVYLGAFLPATGQALTDPAFSDPDSKLGPSLIPSADQLTLDVDPASLTDLFIHDGSPDEKERVLANYRPEPAIPFTNTVTLTSEGFRSVEKVYIKTLKDRVISPGLQDRMIAGAGITTVFELSTSHSPFVAQPLAVTEVLLQVGKLAA